MKVQSFKQDISQAYINPFKEQGIYPFNLIGRVVVDSISGIIKYRLGSEDSSVDENGYPVVLDESSEEVMVYFPAHYMRVYWEGDTRQLSYLTEVPTTINKGAYKVPDIFVREDGSIRPYILVGAYLGSESNSRLRSLPRKTPSHTKTISAFRDLARQGRSTKWNIEYASTITMIQNLYVTMFQSLDSQLTVGKGWTEQSASATTGATEKLGNRSGYLGSDGNQISLFGVEDFWGNMWRFTDGLVIKDDGYYISSSPSTIGDSTKFTKIAGTPLTGSTADALVEGYVTSMTKLTEGSAGSDMFLPDKLGGSENSQYCDYLWSHRKGQTNIARFGADWGNGARAGAFCWYWANVVSNANSNFGARLQFLP